MTGRHTKQARANAVAMGEEIAKEKEELKRDLEKLGRMEEEREDLLDELEEQKKQDVGFADQRAKVRVRELQAEEREGALMTREATVA